MSGRKGWTLLLVLCVPFALYAAWQVNAAARPVAGASEPPADAGASQEQLGAAQTKAGVWAGEVRKAVAVAGQYRKPEPGTLADPAARDALKAAGERADTLADLDTFLAGSTTRPFAREPMKAKYEKWVADRKALGVDAEVIRVWLARRPEIASAADAGKTMASLETLVTKYETRSWLASRGDAAAWRVQARLAVIDGLTALADAQYRAAMGEKLPLDAKNSVTVKATLGELKTQIAALTADRKAADDYKAVLDAATVAAADGKGVVAAEYAARAELLDLFAQPTLFTDAGGAEAWLRAVAERHRGTKDPKVHALIAGKVQEFCEAFVPPAALLDTDVLLKAKTTPRSAVRVRFEKKLGDAPTSQELSADATGFNEFEAVRKPPGFNPQVFAEGSEYELTDLKPTKLSETAIAFNQARKSLGDAASGPKWTAKSAAELKKRCGDFGELVDQLRAPATSPTGAEPKIATRLAGLAAGLTAWEKRLGAKP